MTTSYSKMIVVPQEEYVQLASVHKAQQPIVQQFDDLTRENIQLEQIPDPYRRLQLQSSNLEERKTLKDKMRRIVTLSTPRPYRSRAENLFDFLQPHLRYNEKGEVFDGNTGDVIEESHIDDLLQHAIRDIRRNTSEPDGWVYFRNLLRQLNVPHKLIGSPTILELSKPPSVAGTPKKKKRGKKGKRSIEVKADAKDGGGAKKKRFRIPAKYYKY